METINIIFSSDNNYAPYMGVAICSIFENKKEGYLIDINILDGGIAEDNKIKLKVLEDKYNFKINYIKMDTNFFKDFYISRQITQASYYRILIPDLLPNIQKALYLDCDIIVINDIFELYNINIDNYYFAAVDEENYGVDRLKNLRIPENEKYFNAGVMLINLKKWRETNINKKIIEFIREENHKLDSHDQDAINAILFGQWLNIPYKYNYTSMLVSIHPIDYNQITNNIIIIHYTGLKPWNYSSINVLNKKYFYYFLKTPWKDTGGVSDKSFKNILIKFFLVSANYLLPKQIIEKLKRLKRSLGIRFY